METSTLQRCQFPVLKQNLFCVCQSFHLFVSSANLHIFRPIFKIVCDISVFWPLSRFFSVTDWHLWHWQKKTCNTFFIFCISITGTELCGYNRWRFLYESLQDLEKQFVKQGGFFYVFHGEPVKVFTTLIKVKCKTRTGLLE